MDYPLAANRPGKGMESTMEILDCRPEMLIPPHEPQDEAKLEGLIADMRARGWVGPPILVVGDPEEDGELLALTGSHRLRAARVAGLDTVPVAMTDLPTGWSVDGADLIDAGGCTCRDFAGLCHEDFEPEAKALLRDPPAAADSE